MGVTLRGGFPCAPEYHIEYEDFFTLRSDIALTVSEEFGKHYRDSASRGREQPKEYNAETKRLLAKYKPNKGVYMFLFQPACGGIISCRKCGGLLKQINEATESKIYSNTEAGDKNLTMETLKDLLTQCVKKKKALVWY